MDWNSEIRKDVRESDVVVVCLSKKFNEAGYRQREVRIALDTEQEKPEGEIFIVPARLEVCDVPESLSKWQWVDLFEEGGRRKLIQALRIRADQIGASLRRRGNYGKPAPQDEEAYDNIPPRPEHTSKMRSPSTAEVVSALQRSAKPSGIWIDDKRNAWLDSEKMGTLDDDIEYLLLTYLIEHKGEVCSYKTLANTIEFLLPSWRTSGVPRHLRALSYLSEYAEKIRRLIELDPSRPQCLIEISGQGYKLDW
jgi:hypothetical protein